MHQPSAFEVAFGASYQSDQTAHADYWAKHSFGALAANQPPNTYKAASSEIGGLVLSEMHRSGRDITAVGTLEVWHSLNSLFAVFIRISKSILLPFPYFLSPTVSHSSSNNVILLFATAFVSVRNRLIGRAVLPTPLSHVTKSPSMVPW